MERGAAARRAVFEEMVSETRQLLQDLATGSGGDGREIEGCSPELLRLAGEVERLATKPAPDLVEHVRAHLRDLSGVFSGDAEGAPSTSIAARRVGLAGFRKTEAEILSRAFAGRRAHPEAVPRPANAAAVQALRNYDVVILNLNTAAKSETWSSLDHPILVVGKRDVVSVVWESTRRGPRDFLLAPWDADEVVLRAGLLLSPLAAAAGNPRTPERTEHGGGYRVVIADDDPTTLVLLKTTLCNYGMECQLATDGGQALELARSFRPDALILDLNLPCLDGYQVLTAIRQDPRIHSMQVMVLTSRQQEADIVRGFALGADDYIVKPFSPMELVVRLKRRLARRAV